MSLVSPPPCAPSDPHACKRKSYNIESLLADQQLAPELGMRLLSFLVCFAFGSTQWT